MASMPLERPATIVTLPGTIPPMPAVARILGRYDRSQVEAVIAVAIDLLDVFDGEPDLELNGDEVDGDFAEDELRPGLPKLAPALAASFPTPTSRLTMRAATPTMTGRKTPRRFSRSTASIRRGTLSLRRSKPSAPSWVRTLIASAGRDAIVSNIGAGTALPARTACATVKGEC